MRNWQNVYQTKDYRYKLTPDNDIEIIAYEGADDDVVIPAEIQGRKVTAIGREAFYRRAGLTSVVMPDGVTKIGQDAFRECEELKDIKFSNNLVHIGRRAFLYCAALERIVIPDSVRKIGSESFEKCESLKEIIMPRVSSVGSYAFYFCEKLESAVLPANMEKIGKGSFWACRNLKTIKLPYGITEISDKAFACCANLESVIIPNSVRRIGLGAFLCCKRLKNIKVPDSVTEIGFAAFISCPNLETLEIPASAKLPDNSLNNSLLSIVSRAVVVTRRETAQNKEDFSREFIIPPGETLEEVLDDRNITQRDLALLTDSSERHIDKVIRGSRRITSAFAKKLNAFLI